MACRIGQFLGKLTQLLCIRSSSHMQTVDTYHSDQCCVSDSRFLHQLLGVYFDSINTVSNEAQTWFNRGLVWCYGFDLELAFRCFKQVVELEPDYAMAYWGMAYTSGIYYNKPWDRMQQDELVEKLQLTYRYSRTAKQ